ncbi:MAG: hypothetical protein GY696_36675, partial [Gammaproteobacteria bacterium]|nr:hypothetical protein [Gammaproteobacteria bacterium]
MSTWEQRFRWDETFEIDTYIGRQVDLYVYSWHPEYRHKLCHRGSLKLLEAFVVDRLNGEKRFALNLEPRGQLLVRVSFLAMPVVFRRPIALRRTAYFGIDLTTLTERERDQTGFDVPVALKRLIDEIERRGLDSPGIYLLCGSAEKKRELRHQIGKKDMSK